MSTPSPWNDAQIHAYVDGELEAQAAARLEADGRDDAVLAARIAQQRKLRALLRDAFDPVLEEPIPQRLRDALTGPAPDATVTPIGAARTQGKSAPRPAWSLREWGAMAATLVFGALLGPLLLRGSADRLPVETVAGQLVASAYLDEALSSQLSGAAQPGAATRIGMSFRAAAGQYCRTFALSSGANGLACRHDGRWALQLLEGTGPPASSEGFRQASSALSPSMVGAVEALGAGDSLTTEQEQQRLGSGWDAPGP